MPQKCVFFLRFLFFAIVGPYNQISIERILPVV